MTDTIHTRFARAWESVNNPSLDSTNPHFKNRYASLLNTNCVVRKACNANGIEYMQTPDFIVDEGEVIEFIQTWVRDKDGGRIDLSRMLLPPSSNAQQTGSGITYIKRYLAQCDWFIVGEEDDDAERAMPQPQPKPQPAKKQGKKAVRFEDTNLFRECVSLGVKADGMQKWYKAQDFKDKTIDQLTAPEQKRVQKYLQDVRESIIAVSE